MASWFTHPTSYRLANAVAELKTKRFVEMAGEMPMLLGDSSVVKLMKAHDSHPDFGHLVLLVFEAVLEVVCVSLPGYIVARGGMFDAEAQKMVANLNVQVFTPCLVFTKLASQLNADKLADLAVIPVIFIAQTFVSWVCARLVSKGFGFEKRQTNFVIAMGVFGNSNSLPISLVISLSKTLKGLHWDRIPGDNDNEVAARGILYLLIFQQLGQLVRWTWGYNVLLAPAIEQTKLQNTDAENLIEEGRYRDDPENGRQVDGLLLQDDDDDDDDRKKIGGSDYSFSNVSPSTVSSVASSSQDGAEVRPVNGEILATPADGNISGALGPRQRSASHMTTFPTYSSVSSNSSNPPTVKSRISAFFARIGGSVSALFGNLFSKLPPGLQKALSTTWHYVSKFILGAWAFMNPPLWAMVFALIVASVPALQHAFFTPGTFVSNSVTRAISQSGSVAVPLILVVLGANLARNTIPQGELATTPEAKKEERNLLIAALVSRMLLPTLLMAPLLAVFAKYVPVSILDDPIFVIVCFLLTGAPSALQLAQICQLNNVFMGVMSKLLVQSYVIWILPSTLLLVMLALEVVEWAAQ